MAQPPVSSKEKWESRYRAGDFEPNREAVPFLVGPLVFGVGEVRRCRQPDGKVGATSDVGHRAHKPQHAEDCEQLPLPQVCCVLKQRPLYYLPC